MTMFPPEQKVWPEKWMSTGGERMGSDRTARPSRRHYKMAKTSLLARGEPMIWLTGGGLAIALLMILGLVGLVVWEGTQTFWPKPIVEIKTQDGRIFLGEVTRRSTSQIPAAETLAGNTDLTVAATSTVTRQLLRTGNFDISGTHYQWINDSEIAEESLPDWAVIVERLSWGHFYGFPKEFRMDGEAKGRESAEVWKLFGEQHPSVLERNLEIRRLETEEIGGLNRQIEYARLRLRGAELAAASAAEIDTLRKELESKEASVKEEFDRIRIVIDKLNQENSRSQIVFETAQGDEKVIPLAEIVRATAPNQLTLSGKLAVYRARWWEFLSAEPRAANSEGGVFPAIWGTVAMTLIMTVAVVPFGVLAALYLREYAKAGFMVSVVRIAVNNLAGVPSIVFGVFGLGFFCYIIGGSIDELFFAASLPNPTFGKGGILWSSLTLAILTLPVVIVATEEALAAVPGSMREGSYACGASKWQTIRRIVLPRAMPGIMTGMMLAVARGAGEVAPLMLVGAVKLAPDLPVDSVFPYVHLDRSFMHLGFQIYDSGFQSQNSEAAKPLVFTITLLLVLIVATMGLLGVWVRQKFHRRYLASKF